MRFMSQNGEYVHLLRDEEGNMKAAKCLPECIFYPREVWGTQLRQKAPKSTWETKVHLAKEEEKERHVLRKVSSDCQLLYHYAVVLLEFPKITTASVWKRSKLPGVLIEETRRRREEEGEKEGVQRENIF